MNFNSNGKLKFIYPNLYKKYVVDRDSTRDQANLLGKISCRVVNS